MQKLVSAIKVTIVLVLAMAVSAPLTGTARAYTFGQSHAYDVRLRGNGSAIVNARLTLNNNEKTEQTTYRYTNESGTLSDITAIQQISCSNLPYYMPSLKQQSPAKESMIVDGHKAVATTNLPECYASMRTKETIGTGANQQNVEYFAPNYDYVYKRITAKQTENSFVLSLASPVEPDDSATVVLIYDLSDVAQKKLGAFVYDFKTLKSTDRTNDVSVALSVEDGYVLDGASDQKTNYKSNSTGTNALSLGSGATMDASQQAAVTSYVAGIGDNGMVTEQASTLAAGETLSVTGKYATSSFILHWQRTVIIWVAVALAIIALVIIYKRRRKQLKEKSGQTVGSTHVEEAVLQQPENGQSKDQETFEQQTKPEDNVETSKAKAVATEPVFSNTTASLASSSKFIAIDLRALPFYKYFARCAQAFRSRRVSPVVFGWLCGLAAILYVGLMTLAYIGAGALASNWYYGADVLNMALYWGMFVCIGLALGIGLLVICVALPILYAPNLKTAIRIAFHSIVFLIAVGLILSLLSLVNRKDEPQDYPYYGSTCSSTNGCMNIQ